MLDLTDKKIIEELSKNSRMTMKELGDKVHLTGQAASARVSKLEDKGIIEGYTIQVNQNKMGFHIHTFINIFTKTTNHQPYLNFVKNLKPYILNNYKISGESCYLLEAQFPSNEKLDQFLTELSQYVSYKLSIVINK
ncbi:Lrp/AsnC family transcriptional regulator [Falsibacillus pallidus]|uniref:Lrp/AsnC family transcriptional regulator n=1 Tax=Falsibacillus pallidus TaxID=493781 RepID=UPI003D9788C9